MFRIRLLIAAFVLLLAGTSATVLFSGASAQESTVITPGRRLPYQKFDVEVVVDGCSLTEHYTRGRAYIEAVRGAEYEIRLRNPSSERVAVALFVDGLNTIDAQQTSAWEASKWVIGPRETITISGWQMSSERARRFYFTNERDSYAAKLGRRGNPGVISAVFFHERRRVVPITPPPSSSRSPSKSRSGEAAPTENRAMSSVREEDEAATGIGRSVRHDVRFVDMDLVQRPAAEVTISYDFRSAFAPDPECRVRGRRDN